MIINMPLDPTEPIDLKVYFHLKNELINSYEFHYVII